MFLLVSVHHCISIESSINEFLGETFHLISCMWNISPTWILARSLYSFTFIHFPDSGLYLLNGFDFYFWWHDGENQQLLQYENLFNPSICKKMFSGDLCQSACVPTFHPSTFRFPQEFMSYSIPVRYVSVEIICSSILTVNSHIIHSKISQILILAKRTRLPVILQNQLLMTKFGRILCLAREWHKKCSVFAG